MEQNLDDLTLCQRIATGERHLFARLVDSYSGLVAGALAAQGVPREEIEDLAQTAFVNIYRGLSGYRGEAKLSSWIYRVAINVARGYMKKLAQRPAKASIEEEMESGFQPQDETAGSEPLKLARNRTLDNAMRKLPASERMALSLYYFEELSYEEIAQAMRLNLNTVRTHIRRGKIRLAGMLDESVLAF